MIPITRPWIDAREEEAVSRVLRSGWITQGPEVASFEAEFASASGASHACAVSSCTAALHLALLAVGVGEGDHVLTASSSFIATANAIRYCGAIPVFVDIESGGCNLDPEKLEDSISPMTRAILCVHQMGMPCDMDAILDIARRRGLPVVEDAACATGSAIFRGGQWEPIGRPHGEIACFSFHPRKVITTGEGGMLTTASLNHDAGLRLKRQQAMSVSDTLRHGSPEVTFESYLALGYNYRMTDMAAAVGRVQLSRLPEIVASRRTLAESYRTLLAGVAGLELPHEPKWARSNWQSFSVRLPAGVDQKRVMQRLLDRGVASRRGIMCSHLEPAFMGTNWIAGAGGLRESEAAQRQCILLPLFPGLTEPEQQYVAEVLRDAVTAEGRRLAS